MEQDKLYFIPAAGSPTVEKIRKFTHQLLAIISVVAFIALFSRETIWGIGFMVVIWFVLCAFVIILIRTNVYVIDIYINPLEGLLYFSFMNYRGEEEKKVIDIKKAKYSFKQQATKRGGFGLSIKDKNAKLFVSETRSESKNQTNGFFSHDMAAMDKLIREVRYHI
jgi:hypothetical protein